MTLIYHDIEKIKTLYPTVITVTFVTKVCKKNATFNFQYIFYKYFQFTI
jgi:hypothetical protein